MTTKSDMSGTQDTSSAELQTEALQTAFIKSYKQHKIMITVSRFLILAGFLVLWEFCSAANIIDSFFFSSPSRICKLFLQMCESYEIWTHLSVTLIETLVSFLFVTLISIVSAILLITLPKVAEVLEPTLVVLNSLPKSALAPLIIVWLGTGMKTIIVAGISVALFGSIINMYTGFLQVEEEKIKLIYTLGGTKRDALFKVMVPASVPIILSNMKVNIGLSLVGVIIGEFLAAKRGLGYLIIYGSQVFKLDLLIMSILILCIIAMALYQLLQFAEKRFQR